ncbi:hypothetical protein SAMN05421788_101766 [Filimonas lacunae]|uniref:Uncharacterized protein n=1 Tax=Filimonas lacunae TaxID=477680 RepID=A0A1N7LBN6_9BACT|nr:hypothetical protein [Filimonas lacunae]SIS71191.1 hypothetical protein SAMN05421788_101766 [Filimonas lacunae]
MIAIDFDKTYKLTNVRLHTNSSIGEFYSPQKNGHETLIRIAITPHPEPLLPKVYNLAMGPPIGEIQVDDMIRLKHRNPDYVFSTAILFALTFLTEYPEMLIGLDGSDDLRATLYHSMFTTNRKTMDEFFTTIGVDWYVKLLRNEEDIERNSDGTPYFKQRP